MFHMQWISAWVQKNPRHSARTMCVCVFVYCRTRLGGSEDPWRDAHGGHSTCVSLHDSANVPRISDLLTTAWPIWIHKQAQQTGVHCRHALVAVLRQQYSCKSRSGFTCWLATVTPDVHCRHASAFSALFALFFYSPSASTQTITSQWKPGCIAAVLQKQCQPPSPPRVVCPTFAEAIISSIHFSLQPAGIRGLCQINWGHPLSRTLFHQWNSLLQIALWKKFFQLLIFLAC